MNCEKYQSLIDDLAEAELDEPTAALTESHIFSCRDCRRQYESLKREKGIYARFLFDAEPPPALLLNFQAKLEAEKEKDFRAARTPTPANARKTNVFDFWRLSPALAIPVLLAVFAIAFGWLKFAADDANGDQYIVETMQIELRQAAKIRAAGQSAPSDLPAKIKSGENNSAAKNNKIGGKIESSKTENVSPPAADKKIIAAKNREIERKAFSASAEKNLIAVSRRSEAENQQLQKENLQKENLQKEIAGQIEKVELLLRAFRNARQAEDVQTFDVEYEKAQARKLLEKNVRLRRDAENRGVFYAEELLGRIETYLLDIANLESNSPPEKVLDIKERVKNQSIIASLQTY